MKAEHITQAYRVAKERYAAIGVDTDAAIKNRSDRTIQPRKPISYW